MTDSRKAVPLKLPGSDHAYLQGSLKSDLLFKQPSPMTCQIRNPGISVVPQNSLDECQFSTALFCLMFAFWYS